MSNESTALAAPTQTSALAHPQTLSFDREQLALISDAVCPGASEPELRMFLQVCQVNNLSPFKKQIHAVKRWNSEERRMMTTYQVGIDGLRALAQRSGQYFGQDPAEFDDEDADRPKWARVTVYRLISGTRVPFTGYARWTEYVQTKKDGSPNTFWANKPFHMLAKCAEADALRKGFPDEAGGMYAEEEMGNLHVEVTNENAGTFLEVDEVRGVPDPDFSPKQLANKAEPEKKVEKVVTQSENPEAQISKRPDAEFSKTPSAGVEALFWGQWKQWKGKDSGNEMLGSFSIVQLRQAREVYATKEAETDPSLILALKASCHDEACALVGRTLGLENSEENRPKVLSAIDNTVVPKAVFEGLLPEHEDLWNLPLADLIALTKFAKEWQPDS